MKKGIRRGVCILAAAAVLAGGIQESVFADSVQILQTQKAAESWTQSSALSEENAVTVTTSAQFMEALKEHKSPIIVEGLVTINNGADASGRMLPVMVPGNTVIRGNGASELNSRSPIQLEGDNVTFQDMELTFESTNALGSVPHREIFLAGHSLTLDNVSTWLEGGGGTIGALGGTEKELLPTVYAGGFTGTVNGKNAALTVKNSNAKTMFQGIYMGHGAGNDQKVSYTGNAVLNLDTKATVRDGVDTSQNDQAVINIAGTGIAKATKFFGNENTTLTLREGSIEHAVVENVGNLVLDKGAELTPQTDILQNVTLKNQACLNLTEAPNTVIAGDFTGGAYDMENQVDEKGILVLDCEGLLTIQGTVTGTTQMQTQYRLFPGVLVSGKQYIAANRASESDTNFVLCEKDTENGFELKYSDGAWKAYAEDTGGTEIPQVGSIEIISAPTAVDLSKLMKEYDTMIPDESVFCSLIWRDTNGNILSDDFVEEQGLYCFDYVIGIKTEYWESDDPDILSKTDWNTRIFLVKSQEYPDRYYLQAGDNAKTGAFTFLFCSDYLKQDLDTVADVKALKDTVKAELCIDFYDSTAEQIPDAVDIGSEEITIGEIPDQAYTGKMIQPKIEIVRNSTKESLVLGKDYLAAYENNINVGNQTAIVKVIGIGNYKGERTIPFSIVKSDPSLTLTANQETELHVVYGDRIRFVFQALPENASEAKMTGESPVKFYCGEELLGTAVMNTEGLAIFNYNTKERKIPIGRCEVRAEFDGSAELNPAKESVAVQIVMSRQTLERSEIKNVTLKDFRYDGSTKTAEITGIVMQDDSLFAASGKAGLESCQAGSYRTAKIAEWSLREDESNWYQLPEVSGELAVDTQVRIMPREVRINPVDRTIQVGEAVPDLRAPELGRDYEFVPGYETIQNESPGMVRMFYDGTPDNTKEGSYGICIEAEGNTNYQIVSGKGTLKIQSLGQEETPPVQEEETPPVQEEEQPVHVHKYEAVLTKATPKKNGLYIKKCTVCGKVSERRVICRPKTVTLSAASLVYNGKNRKPVVKITDIQGKTISSSQYQVTYQNNKMVGKASATIIFKDNYSGAMKKTFTIVPKGTSISKLTAKSRGFTVKWKKQTAQTTGYIIQYSTSSKFAKKSTKSVTIKNSRTTGKTISKQKAKKKYYVRICTYKTVKVKGKAVKLCSKWSKVKSVSTRK